MIKKKTIALVVIAVTFILGFDSLLLTKFGLIARLMMLGISTVGFGLFLFYFRQFPKAMRFFGILFIGLFLMSMITTHELYGQSYKIGFYANFSLYAMGAVFLTYYLMVRFKIEPQELIDTFLKSAWAVFAFFAFLHFFNIGFPETSGGGGLKGVGLLQKGMINVGAMIYVAMFFQKNKAKYFLFAIILYSINQWEDFQRYIFVAFLMSLALMLITYKRNSVGIRLIAILMLTVPVLITAISTTSLGQKIYDKLSGITELFDSKDDDFSDDSIGVRVEKSEYALGVFMQHPLTGVGRMHNTLKETYTGEEHFYIADIGVIGILFSYGIGGLLLFFLQAGYFMRHFFKRRFTSNTYTIGIKLVLFYLLLKTVASGELVHSPFQFLALVGVIEYCRLIQIKREETIEAAA